LGDYKVVM
jgi:hypothetical protein